ncbi:MAG: DUF4093 domain-containing protein [Ruminococcus sp.]|nr:DUF4093 domain-containing protein [Ruminococcus sp.]
MPEKIQLKEAVLVEGRYDRIKLSEFIASPIIETGGFRVFKDKEKQALIRAIAARRGILVMTDVDSAGFVIRNFLRGIVPESQLFHAYIPTVQGKERRKPEPSKEGVLGVEGLDRETLLKAIQTSGAHILKSLPLEGKVSPPAKAVTDEVETLPVDSYLKEEHPFITKFDLYTYSLSGTPDAAKNRAALLSALGLPKYLTANALLSALNCLFTKEEFERYLEEHY